MMAAFVLGEVWQAESSQTGIKIGVVGVFILCSIFCIVRVLESQSKQTIYLEAGCLLLFFCIGFWRMKTESQEKEIDFLIKQKEQIMVEGTLYKTGKTAYYNQYYLKDAVIISETGERWKAGAIQLSVKADAVQEEVLDLIKIGNRVCAGGRAEIPDRATNPGGFDWYLYYRALGIRYQIKTEQIWILDKHIDWIKEGLKTFKEQLKTVYQTICTEKDYGIFCAVLLGEKQDLDAEIKSLYEENGISHILAISGLHISLIGMGLYHFLRKWFGFLPSQIVAGLVMAAYVVMTGAGVSTVRAYLMFLFLLTAAVLGRTYDIAVAAGWIALILLFRNPYLIYYAGFLLSFGAIVGIGVVGTILNEYVGSQNTVLKAIISSMSVIWVTLPLTSYFFFTYATWSIVLNLLVIPCMTLVMISGITGGLLGLCFPVVGILGIGIGHYILCFYEKICLLAERLPNHQILIGCPKWWQIGIYYGIVGSVCVWCNWQYGQRSLEKAGNNRRREEIFSRVVKLSGLKDGWIAQSFLCQRERVLEQIFIWGRAIILGGVMVLLVGVLCFRGSGRLEVTFLDVSQGDGIFLRFPSGEVCLIDGGSSDIKKVGQYRILPFLQSEQVADLDFVFISHADLDHISGVKEILESDICKIKTLCLPDIDKADKAYLELVKMAEESGSQIVFLKAGDQISKGKLLLQCVHPQERKEWSDRNSYSMVLWLRYGEIDFLFTGDIGEEQERKMLSSFFLPQGLEVLKVAHHGSQYSSCQDFLEWVSPKYAVISCGKGNFYGHPHTEAVERIVRGETEVLLTQDRGAITFISDGQRLKVVTYLNNIEN